MKMGTCNGGRRFTFILATEVTFEPDTLMTTISVPDPEWTVNVAGEVGSKST